jgi:hypothetical protein
MPTHEKVPRAPAVIASGICITAIGIGVITMAGTVITMLARPTTATSALAVTITVAGVATLAALTIIGWRQLRVSLRYHVPTPPSEETPMSGISGSEPAHWHDEHGHHRMKDPREVYGNHWKNQTGNWTDADERAYTRHLIAHESMLVAPEPQPGDTEAIRSLVRAMQGAEEILRTGTELIATLRQEQQQKEADE